MREIPSGPGGPGSIPGPGTKILQAAGRSQKKKFCEKSYNSFNGGAECSNTILTISWKTFSGQKFTFPGPRPDPGIWGGGGRKEFHGAAFDLMLFGLFTGDLEEFSLSSVEI